LEGVGRPDLDSSSEQRPLVGSESLQDLTQAIISSRSSAPEDQGEDNHSLTDQASQLDKLVSKVMLTFQTIIKQQQLSAIQATKIK